MQEITLIFSVDVRRCAASLGFSNHISEDLYSRALHQHLPITDLSKYLLRGYASLRSILPL